MMADYRDVAGWCEYRPEMANYNDPYNVSAVVTSHGPAFYLGAQIELGHGMATAAMTREVLKP